MKSSVLLQHIGIALLISLLAMLNDFIFRLFFSGLFSSELNIVLSIFLYLVFIIWQSRLIAGKISLLMIDLSILLTCLYTNLASVSLFFICLLLIWLNRLLLCYSSVIAVLADFCLCLLSALGVYWLIVSGHNLISTLWCLLLLQSLHCLLADQKMSSRPQRLASDKFDQALQSAESALQQLIK